MRCRKKFWQRTPFRSPWMMHGFKAWRYRRPSATSCACNIIWVDQEAGLTWRFLSPDEHNSFQEPALENLRYSHFPSTVRRDRLLRYYQPNDILHKRARHSDDKAGAIWLLHRKIPEFPWWGYRRILIVTRALPEEAWLDRPSRKSSEPLRQVVDLVAIPSIPGMVQISEYHRVSRRGHQVASPYPPPATASPPTSSTPLKIIHSGYRPDTRESFMSAPTCRRLAGRSRGKSIRYIPWVSAMHIK